MSFCCKCKAGICKTQDCDSFCDCHPQEYPNDKETQEWMNAPLGKPISTPKEPNICLGIVGVILQR